MDWIILAVEYSNEKVKDCDIVRDGDTSIKLFKNRSESDAWLEENHEVGVSYHQVEIW